MQLESSLCLMVKSWNKVKMSCNHLHYIKFVWLTLFRCKVSSSLESAIRNRYIRQIESRCPLCFVCHMRLLGFSA